MAALPLRDAFATFARRPTARLLAAALAACAALRLGLGGLGPGDLVVAGAVALAQPFVEWLVHVNVLHLRPFTVAGRRVDVGYTHRVHHDDPKDLAHVFVDARFLLATFAVDAGLWALAYARGAGWLGTLVLCAVAGALAYEWTHYLIHTDYAPRSRLYRGIRRAHLLHHYRDDRYWYGVTGHLADRVLGTYPRADEVTGGRTVTA
ncbi:MAG TPA: sterol desaturase family protein [Frankiaceae bacterium]|jgi:sterol desaturase/sphingolipid hydroxylase (fatty acid hydroxylase superfamily)|nr:sterol desaturase family protein [Frankiaceae bacterium]